MLVSYARVSKSDGNLDLQKDSLIAANVLPNKIYEEYAIKYEGSYLYKWNSVSDLKTNISKWIEWYNYKRPHQALDYATPSEVYYGFMDKSLDLPTIPQYQHTPKKWTMPIKN